MLLHFIRLIRQSSYVMIKSAEEACQCHPCAAKMICSASYFGRFRIRERPIRLNEEVKEVEDPDAP